MATKREKMLLDFTFEKENENKKFIEMNGYTAEELTYVSVYVYNKDQYIRSEINTLWPSGNSKRYVEMLSIDGDTPSYRQLNWEDKS